MLLAFCFGLHVQLWDSDLALIYWTRAYPPCFPFILVFDVCMSSHGGISPLFPSFL